MIPPASGAMADHGVYKARGIEVDLFPDLVVEGEGSVVSKRMLTPPHDPRQVRGVL